MTPQSLVPVLSALALLATHLSGLAAPLQIYILAGQSNMQGHAHIRTIEHVAMDPATIPLFKEMTNPDGSHKTCQRVWISSIGCLDHETKEQTGKLTTGFGASQNGPKIGPEFTFGLTMEKSSDAPILIIKTAWGGKSLNTDFRPPSAGPYQFTPSQLAHFEKQGKDIAAIKAEKTQQTGVYYRMMLAHVKTVLADIKRVVPDYDPAQGYELSGFAWFQGWNDMVDSGTYPNRNQPGGYDEYSKVMAHFIRDVRKDLGKPELPFVIGVLGVGGPTSEYGPDEQRYKSTHENFRNAMAAPASLPEFKGNVTAVLTEKYWDKELTAAQAKENLLKQEARKLATSKNLNPKEENATFEKLRLENLTERERTILEKGISNFAFHYLGSAKILGGIGKGLAEAMIELQPSTGQ
jgi:alpha-galactosidase